MSTIITGRKIDINGNPIGGTGFTYESDGQLAQLFAQRISPLFSQPVTGEWVFGLVSSQQSGGKFERGVGIFTSGNKGPAEHFHPKYDEHFDVLQGEFIFTIGGQQRNLHAGEKLVITKGVPHTFRCVGGQYGVAVVETQPAARIGEVISTLFGLAHEGLLSPQGQPGFLQAMVIGGEYPDDTVFTNPPPNIAIPLAKALAPLGRLFGYRPTYAKYADETYWRAHVEQPQPDVFANQS